MAVQAPSLLSKLKAFALNWAINRCHSQLGQTSEHLPILATNKGLAPSECEMHEKKIVIEDNAIVIYEHYSEPGNPFLAYRHIDFRDFMRAWLKPMINRAADDFLITIPEYRLSYEKAKAAYD